MAKVAAGTTNVGTATATRSREVRCGPASPHRTVAREEARAAAEIKAATCLRWYKAAALLPPRYGRAVRGCGQIPKWATRQRPPWSLPCRRCAARQPLCALAYSALAYSALAYSALAYSAPVHLQQAAVPAVVFSEVRLRVLDGRQGPEMSIEQVVRKIDNLLREFLNNQESQEAIECVKEVPRPTESLRQLECCAMNALRH